MKPPITYLAISCALLSSCTQIDRHSVALSISKDGALTPNTYQTPHFTLQAYQRINTHNAYATIYIEGDGLAWINRSTPSQDPTPKNPVALSLAAQDERGNVIYLARPCQYTGQPMPAQCTRRYWMGSRFAPEVISTYNAALDTIKQRYNVNKFELIGFSGGGNIAAILAAQRPDVHAFKTVAGNLDPDAHSKHHRVSMLKNSLNSAHFMDQLRVVPQIHYSGTKDKIVPPQLTESYLRQLNSSCAQQIHVPAKHVDGWAEQWSNLAQAPYPDCR